MTGFIATTAQVGTEPSPAAPTWLIRLSNSTDASVLRTMRDVPGRLVWCRDMGDLAAAVPSDNIAGVVLDLSDSTMNELETISAAVARRVWPIPFVMRFELTHASVELAIALEHRLAESEISLRGYDDIRSSLSNNRPHFVDVRRSLIRRLAPNVPASVRRIVVGAAVIGERAVSVADLGACCGTSMRTLELQLRNGGLTTAKRLLMCMLAVHAGYHAHCAGGSTKRAAAFTATQSARALAARVERATGVPFPEWVGRYTTAERIEHVTTLVLSR